MRRNAKAGTPSARTSWPRRACCSPASRAGLRRSRTTARTSRPSASSRRWRWSRAASRLWTWRPAQASARKRALPENSPKCLKTYSITRYHPRKLPRRTTRSECYHSSWVCHAAEALRGHHRKRTAGSKAPCSARQRPRDQVPLRVRVKSRSATKEVTLPQLLGSVEELAVADPAFWPAVLPGSLLDRGRHGALARIPVLRRPGGDAVRPSDQTDSRAEQPRS